VHRTLSWAGIPVSPLALGLSRIGSFSSSLGHRQAQFLMKTAFDLGINVFDTADIYGQGESERLLGATFRSTRDQIVFCTKIGFRLSARARFASFAKPVLKPIWAWATNRSDKLKVVVEAARTADLRHDFSTNYLISAIEASLRRLRTDYIDLLLLHSPPVRGFEPEEVLGVLNAAKSHGKIRAYGVSCLSAADAHTWIRLPGIAVIQIRFGKFEQETAVPILLEAKHRNIGIIAREVLSGSGLLDRKPDAPAGQRSEDFVNAVDHTALGDALRAPLLCKSIDCIIVGTTRIDHLKANVDAIAGTLRN
jgi:aryl-alcohol dehydrogenase-like predicted oxidoreductase